MKSNDRAKPARRTGGGIKKEIRSFSNASRRNYLKAFGRIPEDRLPTLWQDFSFPDDVMQNKTLKQRAVYSTETIHRFRKRFKRKFPDAYILWKREWQPRKSGPLTGEWCPHIHALIGFSGDEHGSALARTRELAGAWVECTQTKEVDKAMSVALHKESSRKIESVALARRYAVAYTGKQDYQLFTESPGRFWGACGTLPQEAGKDIELSFHDEIWLRRIMRRMTSKKKKNFRKHLSKPGTSTFFLIEHNELDRLLAWIRTVPDLDKNIKQKGGENNVKRENRGNENRRE